jgi:uncharacterized protein YegP (UPF0339 family)
MKREYDFSKGIRGKFYRGNRTFQVVIEVPETTLHPRYEVFKALDGKFRFRLKTDSSIMFVSEDEFETKADCLDAIARLKQASVLAPTVFA